MPRTMHMGYVALILALFAILSAALARWIDVSGEVLNIPITVRSGYTGTRVFRVPVKAQYRIGVECSRSVPFEILKSLLQSGNLVDISVQRGGRALELAYFAGPVFERGVESTAEFGNLNFGNKSIGQDIAYFAGEPGEPYTIVYTVVRTVDELASTNPTLVIYFDPREAIGRGIASIAFRVISYVLAAFSAVVGIAYVFSLWRRTH
jgi:hypothetical protein